ncbi:hypothetical protein [Vibrio nomapromontoriensis]|uniref:hypothetical protein n=1 Tax=Vibrio nomapromontoriensis TaxID=2910246 RepID=UPI003D0BB186
MKAIVSGRPTTQQDKEDWQQELELWGMDEAEQESESVPELWQENVNVVMWWLSIPNFLQFTPNLQSGRTVCTGMDVLAVQADSQLSGRAVNTHDYDKLKVIARTLTETYNL